MQNLKDLTKEFMAKFNELQGRLIITVGLVFLLQISFFMTMIFPFWFIQTFPGRASAVLLVAYFVFIFAMIFVLHYGAMVLFSRLNRGLPSNLGYLFLGFKHTRTSSCVAIFTYMMVICLVLAAIPLMKIIDFSSNEAFLSSFKNADLLFTTSIFGSFIFMIGCIVMYFRFSFVWIIVYENPECTGFKAFIKSWKMLRGHVMQYIGFLFLIIWQNLLVIASLDGVSFAIKYFTHEKLSFTAAYIFSIVNLGAILSMQAKVCLAIPYYYDKLCSRDVKPQN